MNLINLENVTKSYLNKIFNFKIKNGESLLIVGENGSGKSTLIKLITNYIVNKGGLLEVNTKNISYLEEIIELPQNIKVSKYLEIMKDIKKGEVDKYLLEVFNIPTNKYIFELSKGNKQKLAIISTFIGKSDLYVLDEPLNGLDDKTINIFIEYLKTIKSTVLLVTHYPFKYLELRYKIVSL